MEIFDRFSRYLPQTPLNEQHSFAYIGDEFGYSLISELIRVIKISPNELTYTFDMTNPAAVIISSNFLRTSNREWPRIPDTNDLDKSSPWYVLKSECIKRSIPIIGWFFNSISIESELEELIDIALISDAAGTPTVDLSVSHFSAPLFAHLPRQFGPQFERPMEPVAIGFRGFQSFPDRNSLGVDRRRDFEKHGWKLTQPEETLRGKLRASSSDSFAFSENLFPYQREQAGLVATIANTGNPPPTEFLDEILHGRLPSILCLDGKRVAPIFQNIFLNAKPRLFSPEQLQNLSFELFNAEHEFWNIWLDVVENGLFANGFSQFLKKSELVSPEETNNLCIEYKSDAAVPLSAADKASLCTAGVNILETFPSKKEYTFFHEGQVQMHAVDQRFGDQVRSEKNAVVVPGECSIRTIRTIFSLKKIGMKDQSIDLPSFANKELISWITVEL